ncbi:DUF998 domain-containing protein [Microbacterium sp.]|uniref:DUF998 domain-containing protein n=1 Tax=Microbacterium sp. TaxID=51671 RepID=UPI0035B266FB
MSRATRLLLVGAVVATPLFVVLWALQAFTREGFRPTFHPMSLLSLGEGGWVQILNFVVTGLLIAGGGIGLGRALTRGRLTRWANVLIALMGVGLIVAGVFVTDAGAGFPAGAPAGAPEMSWHGALHQAGFLITQLAFVAAAVVLAVRFGRRRQWGWMTATIAALVAAVLVPALGDAETLAIRLVISAAIELGLVSAIALGALLGRVE